MVFYVFFHDNVTVNKTWYRQCCPSSVPPHGPKCPQWVTGMLNILLCQYFHKYCTKMNIRNPHVERGSFFPRLMLRFPPILAGSKSHLPGSAPGCRTGNGEKLSSTQAEPVQAIKSAVAYFPSISCATSWRRSR